MHKRRPHVLARIARRESASESVSLASIAVSRCIGTCAAIAARDSMRRSMRFFATCAFPYGGLSCDDTPELTMKHKVFAVSGAGPGAVDGDLTNLEPLTFLASCINNSAVRIVPTCGCGYSGFGVDWCASHAFFSNLDGAPALEVRSTVVRPR